MTRKRKRFTSEQKAAVLRRHLLDGKSISDLCEEHGIAPTMFYRWQKQMFENLSDLFERNDGSGEGHLAEENAQLRQTIARKDGVIAEVTQELIDAKKQIGGFP